MRSLTVRAINIYNILLLYEHILTDSMLFILTLPCDHFSHLCIEFIVQKALCFYDP